MGQYINRMRELGKMLDTTEDKKMPSIVKRVFNFKAEHKIWVDAGKPMRPQHRIEEIFNRYCKDCQHFNGKSCNICGCFINTGTTLNKISWATTKCPDEPPKWEPEMKVPEPTEYVEEEIIEKGETTEESAASPPEPVEVKPAKPKGGCGCGG